MVEYDMTEGVRKVAALGKMLTSSGLQLLSACEEDVLCPLDIWLSLLDGLGQQGHS